MASFSNPFATAGYGNTSLGGFSSGEEVSISYLTGNPNPQSLNDPTQVIIFKNLLKKDAKTREKGLSDLLAWLNDAAVDSDSISDNLHFSWIQIYAKLSIDVSTTARLLSHQVLGALFKKLGKRSSKHLKSAIGPWIAGTHDPDTQTAKAAKDSLNSLFNPERQALLIEKLIENLLEFVSNVIQNETPDTLSDTRFISAEDAALKYARVLKTTLDLLNHDLLPLKSIQEHDEKVEEILHSKALWKLTGSDNSQISQSVLALANNNVARLKASSSIVWKELIKSLSKNPFVTLDIIRTLTALTKADSSEWRDSDITALAQAVSQKNHRPKTFWPLLYNLVLMVPSDLGITQESTFSRVFAALSKAVPPIIGDSEVSAWGCLLALTSKSTIEKYMLLSMDLIEKRSSMRTVSKDLSRVFSERCKEFSKLEAVHKHLAQQLTNLSGDKLVSYCGIIASSGAFSEELAPAISSMTLCEFASLLKLVPSVSFSVTDVLSKDKDSLEELLDIAAATSITENSQQLLDFVLQQDGGDRLALSRAQSLASKGLKANLEAAVDESSNESLLQAIIAHGTLISNARAEVYLEQLVQQDDALEYINSVATRCPEFFAEALKKFPAELVSRLYSLEHEPQIEGLITKLNSLDTLDKLMSDLEHGLDSADSAVEKFVSRAVLLITDSDSAHKALLLDADWLKPSALHTTIDSISQYPVKWVDSQPDNEPHSFVSVLNIAVYVMSVWHQVSKKQYLSEDETSSLKHSLRVVASAARGHLYVNAYPSVSELAEAFIEDVNILSQYDNDIKIAWDTLVKNRENSLGFHSAQIYHSFVSDSPSEVFQSLLDNSRREFDKVSLITSLFASFHISHGTVWYDRYRTGLARSLDKDFSTSNLASIDTSFNVESLGLEDIFMSKLADADGIEFALALEILSQFETGVTPPQSVTSKALVNSTASQYTILRILNPASYSELVGLTFLEHEFKNSPLNDDLVREYLRHAKSAFTSEENLDLDLETVLSKFKTSELAWVGYCYSHRYIVKTYKEQLLESQFENASLLPELENAINSQSLTTVEQALQLLLYLDLVRVYSEESSKEDRKYPPSNTMFGHYSSITDRVLSFIADGIREYPLSDFGSLKAEEIVIGNEASLVLHMLYLACSYLGGSVRSWFREITDRALSKTVSSLLSSHISQAVMRTVSRELEVSKDDEAFENTSVSELSREIRATMEVEDQEVTIIISLSELHPARPSTIHIKGLGGVPEGKKRAWLLEAENGVQNGAMLKAMRTLLLRFDNFMQGFDPCAICYSIVLENKSLPTKECGTCHNRYHNDCLHKWAASSGSRVCPICRSNI